MDPEGGLREARCRARLPPLPPLACSERECRPPRRDITEVHLLSRNAMPYLIFASTLVTSSVF